MPAYLALLAEATNAISGVVIVSCLLLVTMLIIRYQGGGAEEGGGAVVRVQHRPVQVAVQKLYVPYTLTLQGVQREAAQETDDCSAASHLKHDPSCIKTCLKQQHVDAGTEGGDGTSTPTSTPNTTTAPTSSVSSIDTTTSVSSPTISSNFPLLVSVCCGCSGSGDSCLVAWWWAVPRRQLVPLLRTDWYHFHEAVWDGLALLDCRGGREEVPTGHHSLDLLLESPLELGAPPRELYPLVVVQLDPRTSKHRDSNQVGAVITVLHVPDALCPEPARVMYQYLKQRTGQLTLVTTLYTQTNGVDPSHTETEADHRAAATAKDGSPAAVAASSTDAPAAVPPPSCVQDVDLSSTLTAEHTSIEGSGQGNRSPIDTGADGVSSVKHRRRAPSPATASNAVATGAADAVNNAPEGTAVHESNSKTVCHRSSEQQSGADGSVEGSITLCARNITNHHASGLHSNSVHGSNNAIVEEMKERGGHPVSCIPSSFEHSNNDDISYISTVVDSINGDQASPVEDGRLNSSDNGASLTGLEGNSVSENCIRVRTNASRLEDLNSHLLYCADPSRGSSAGDSSTRTATEDTHSSVAGPEATLSSSSTAAAAASPDECVVCQASRSCLALLPCRHVCVCHQCFSTLMASQQSCPLCRAPVSAYFVV